MKTTTSKMLDALKKFSRGVWHTENWSSWIGQVSSIIKEAEKQTLENGSRLTEIDMTPEGSPLSRRTIYLGITKDGYPLAAFGADGPALQEWLNDNEGSQSRIVILNE